MKLTILLLFLILMNCSSLLSQVQDSIKSNDDNFMMVQLLIRMDYEENKGLIFEKSKKLSEFQKLFIYYDNKKSSTLPFFLNLLVGLGIGSWVQGDNTGGIIGTIGQLGGFLLTLNSKNSTSVGSFGLTVMLTSYLYGLIRPSEFSSNYNRNFKAILGIDHVKDISLNPNLKMLTNGQVYPELSINIIIK